MKSILQGPKEEKVEEKKYPYLGISKIGAVVLFSSESTGVLVHDPNPRFSPGFYLDTWRDSDFASLKGKLILFN